MIQDRLVEFLIPDLDGPPTRIELKPLTSNSSLDRLRHIVFADFLTRVSYSGVELDSGGFVHFFVIGITTTFDIKDIRMRDFELVAEIRLDTGRGVAAIQH